MTKSSKQKQKLKLCPHFLFLFLLGSAGRQFGTKHIYLFHFSDRTAIMICHEQVSLHINYIYQLV